MNATAAPGAGANGAPPFGAGRLFLADSRLALALLNEGRHRCMRGVFGVSGPDENILTVVLLLGATSATYGGARRVVRAPLRLTRGDGAMGALLVREAMAGVAG